MDIRIIKVVSGDNYIGILDKEDELTLTLVRPMYLGIFPGQGIAVMDIISDITPDKEIVLQKAHVVTNWTAIGDIAADYNFKVSGIVAPPPKKLDLGVL